MAGVVYEVVEHDGGWAYKVGGVFSETFPDRETAEEAAAIAAIEQKRPGETQDIEYQDEQGRWQTEHSEGSDRPNTEVVTKP